MSQITISWELCVETKEGEITGWYVTERSRGPAIWRTDSEQVMFCAPRECLRDAIIDLGSFIKEVRGLKLLAQ